MYDGLRFLYRVCSFIHFTASFQRPLLQGSARVCAQSRSGKRSRSVSKSALFFPLLVPIDIHEPIQPAAKCGTSTRDGLIERLADVLHFISQRDSRFSGFGFLEFLSFTARYACRFSRAPHLYDIAVLEKLYIFLLPLLYITQRPETDMSLSAQAYSEESSISKQYANVF